MTHFLGLLESVFEFINVVAIGCKAYAQGALSTVVAETLDGFRGAVTVARLEVNGVAVVMAGCHFRFACGGEVPCDAIPETFIEVEGASRGV